MIYQKASWQRIFLAVKIEDKLRGEAEKLYSMHDFGNILKYRAFFCKKNEQNGHPKQDLSWIPNWRDRSRVESQSRATDSFNLNFWGWDIFPRWFVQDKFNESKKYKRTQPNWTFSSHGLSDRVKKAQILYFVQIIKDIVKKIEFLDFDLQNHLRFHEISTKKQLLEAMFYSKKSGYLELNILHRLMTIKNTKEWFPTQLNFRNHKKDHQKVSEAEEQEPIKPNDINVRDNNGIYFLLEQVQCSFRHERIKLIRSIAYSSVDKGWDFYDENKSEGIPVHVYIDAELKASLPMATIGMELII